MKPFVGAVAASFFVAVAILLLSWTTYFAQLNSTAYDFTLRLAGPVPPKSPTLIVAIDEDSLGKIGPWPWPRDKLAGLIERVEMDAPRVIAVDLLLDDKTTEDADARLADAISKTKSIVLAARIDAAGRRNRLRWRLPRADFAQKHVGLGHVHADPDFDGISRRVFPVKEAEGAAYPAFAFQVLNVAGTNIEAKFLERIGAARIIRPQPFNIRFAGDNKSFEHVPAWQLLEGGEEPGRFKDKIVLIGATAAGLQDQWFTPFALSAQKMSGVEIHANAIETLYAGRDIQQTSDLLLLILLFAGVLLLWWLDRRFEGRRFFAAAVLLGPLAFVVSYVLMKHFSAWLPFPPFWAAIVFVVPGLEVANRLRVNRDLDQKIERLSGLGTDIVRDALLWDARERVLESLPSGPDREAWLAAIDDYEREAGNRRKGRKKLFAAHRGNYRWRLNAVDFFNEELVRFLSFNSAILSSIEDVIVVSDPAGRVLYQNPAARRLAGFRDDPPFAPDYAASLLDGRGFAAGFAAVLAKAEPLTMEFVPGRNGKNYYNVTLSPISRIGVVLSMHDATAQHELNQAKTDMVSLVSHELRTPLTSIRGYSDMLLKYGLVQDKGKPFLGTIIDESRRLNQLIQSFLDIAYIESGRQKITLSEFEIGPLLKDMLSVVGPAAAEKQITLETLPNTEAERVRADRLLLYQALTNLVTNAIKYSPRQTTVRIGVSNGDGRVRFDIADQGCGIPAEEASKIFEKFYRRANKETRDQTGFGLGLAFVKEVAARHGGDVFVESEVGKGSTFTLWIPD